MANVGAHLCTPFFSLLQRLVCHFLLLCCGLFQVIAILDKIKNEKSGTDQNVEELDPSENEDDAEQLRSSPNEDDSDWEDEDPDDEGIIYVE